jgi:hypothetical protein
MILDLQPYTGIEANLCKPCTIMDVGGGTWNVATDRAWLVAVKGDKKYQDWKGNETQLNIILGFIQSHPVDPICVGKGELDRWVATAGNKYGRIAGVVIDLERLYKLLALVPTRTVQIWDATIRQAACLGLEAESVRIFLMGVQGISNFSRFGLVKESVKLVGEIPKIETAETVEVAKDIEAGEELSGFELARLLGLVDD